LFNIYQSYIGLSYISNIFISLKCK